MLQVCVNTACAVHDSKNENPITAKTSALQHRRSFAASSGRPSLHFMLSRVPYFVVDTHIMIVRERYGMLRTLYECMHFVP